MSKILVIAGHPNYKASFANRNILDEFHKLVPHADIVYLDALYNMKPINVEEEQRRLRGANVIVLEFPIWWYSSPSLMHRYVEDVFTHGFAYGSQGKALNDKKFILSFTFGSSQEDYTPMGAQHVTVEQLLPPFLAMVNLTGMDWKGYIASFGMALINPSDEKIKEEILTKAKHHALRLANLAEGTV